MRSSGRSTLARTFVCVLLISACWPIAPPAEAQIFKRVLQAGACALGGKAGAEIGERLAEIEAKRRNLAPRGREELEKQYKIGIALALCGGGAALAGTAFDRLSERGRQEREAVVLAALDDAQMHTYVDPEDPQLQGTVVARPSVIEGDEECTVMEDRLGGDVALIKYCREMGGPWKVKAI